MTTLITPPKVNMMNRITMRQSEIMSMTYYDARYAHHYPIFDCRTIDMMIRDSRIQYGLSLIKGPVSAYTKFFSSEDADDPAINQSVIDLDYHFSYKVECDDKKQETFILKMLNRFWEVALFKALRAIEFGHSSNQVFYTKTKEGIYEFEDLEHYDVRIAKPVSNRGRLAGIHLISRNKFIALPKSFVHVHQREYHKFIGRSKLINAHIPWHETWHLGGARDIRKNWYHRCSYDGGTAYIPGGSSELPDGTIVSNMEAASKIMENSVTGSFRIFPKPENAGKNERSWEFDPPKANTTPDGMPEYLQDLRIEVLEGMGIPPEVVENANSNGMGSSSGRKIPLLAFYSTLSPITSDLIHDYRCQILNPLLEVNGMNADYDITRMIPKTFDPSAQGGPGSLESPDMDTSDR